jgi:hypothetical protein
MPAAASAFELQNRFLEPVRVRLDCDGMTAWDAWLPSRGHVRVPPFPSGRMSFEAHLFDEASQVDFATCIDEIAIGAHVTAVVRIDRGAPLFALEAAAPSGRHAFRVSNPTRWPIGLVVRFAGSPYVLRACVARGGERALDPTGGFRLEATQGGLTARRQLPRAEGRWIVGPCAAGTGPCIDPSPAAVRPA